MTCSSLHSSKCSYCTSESIYKKSSTQSQCYPIEELSRRPAQFPQTQRREGEEGEAGQEEEEEEKEEEPRKLPLSELAGACCVCQSSYEPSHKQSWRR